MSDTKHDIAGLIDQMTQAIDAVRPGGVFSSNSKLSAALFALYEAMPALTALQAERDAAISKVDFYEQKDGMGGAVVHAIREILYAHNVPKAAFIDDHVTNAIVQRDAWKARAEAAEVALAETMAALSWSKANLQSLAVQVSDQERNYLHLYTAAYDVWRWFEVARPELIGPRAEALRDAVMGPRPYGSVLFPAASPADPAKEVADE